MISYVRVCNLLIKFNSSFAHVDLLNPITIRRIRSSIQNQTPVPVVWFVGLRPSFCRHLSRVQSLIYDFTCPYPHISNIKSHIWTEWFHRQIVVKFPLRLMTEDLIKEETEEEGIRNKRKDMKVTLLQTLFIWFMCFLYFPLQQCLYTSPKAMK